MPSNMPAEPNLFFPGDWLSCNSVYGTNLVLEDCLEAVNQLPRGTSPVEYGPGRGQFTLPIQKHQGQFL